MDSEERIDEVEGIEGKVNSDEKYLDNLGRLKTDLPEDGNESTGSPQMKGETGQAATEKLECSEDEQINKQNKINNSESQTLTMASECKEDLSACKGKNEDERRKNQDEEKAYEGPSVIKLKQQSSSILKVDYGENSSDGMKQAQEEESEEPSVNTINQGSSLIIYDSHIENYYGKKIFEKYEANVNSGTTLEEPVSGILKDHTYFRKRKKISEDENDISDNDDCSIVSLKKSKREENESIDNANPSIEETEFSFGSKYNFEKITLIASAEKPFLDMENYLKGCKWSPDGHCLLTSSQDNYLRLFDLPRSVCEKETWKADNQQLPEICPSVKVFEGALICDFAWYPKMTLNDPSTCCFLSSSRGAPVHLWDAVDGSLKASYLGYDYSDEVTSAYSVSFDTAGEKIYCGYDSHIRIFDTDIPGRSCITIKLKSVSKQKGLVSCIIENPILQSVFAVGTYKTSIGLYTVDGSNICELKGQKGGVTHLLFSKDGSKLYSGARKDGEILCWDLRNPGRVLYTMQRAVTTNQRIYFDLSPEGSYILSGGTDGIVKIWETEHPIYKKSEENLKVFKEFKAHNDCVNGISVNPVYPILGTSSGQRHFADVLSDDDDNNVFSQKTELKKEYSVKLWLVGS